MRNQAVVTSGGSPIENDLFTTHDNAADAFHTGDNAQVLVTSFAPTGGVTTVTITDTASDNGTVKARDEVDDNETLPTKFSGETDNITFDDSASEQDTARDNTKIVIRTLGLVAANDCVDSTETLTLAGTEQTTDAISDPGTENDSFGAPTSGGGVGSGSETESDKLTENSDVKDTARNKATDNLLEFSNSWTRNRSHSGIRVLRQSQGDRHIFPGTLLRRGMRIGRVRGRFAGKMSQSPACERLRWTPLAADALGRADGHHIGEEGPQVVGSASHFECRPVTE